MEQYSAWLALCEGNDRWIPLTKARDAELWFFICAWTNGWVNNRDAGDLRCCRSHYDATVMQFYRLQWSIRSCVWLCDYVMISSDQRRPTHLHIHMLCTAQLPGSVLKAFGRARFSLLQLADKSPMITDQHTAGGSVSQLSQLAKLSPWLTLSTKDITTSFWHYKKWFCFLSNQIMGLYHFSNPTE